MAKYLTERTEIATKINLEKVPTLRINLETCYKDYDNLYVGDDVRIGYGDRGLYTRGHIYKEGNNYEISNMCDCISASFGYSDIEEMAHWSNTPLLAKGQTVIVIEDYPKSRCCKIREMKVSDRIDPHCATVCKLEDVA